jgi:hypothetical protein
MDWNNLAQDKQTVCCCERGNELRTFVIFKLMCDYQLLKDDSNLDSVTSELIYYILMAFS